MVQKIRVVNNIEEGLIGPSSIHGLGLFAKRDLPVDSVLTILDGQLVSWNDYKNHENVVAGEWNAVAKDTLLVRVFPTKYKFVNHSRSPNLTLQKIGRSSLLLLTSAPILAGEEMLLDYRKEALPDEYVNGHGSSYL